MFRNCQAPVTSYGIVAVKYDKDNLQKMFSRLDIVDKGNESEALEYLLIRRKDSLSFVEFLRGKYGVSDDEYITKIIRGMTQKEQEMILLGSFDDLWLKLWGESSPSRSHRNDYDISKKKYYQIFDKLESIIGMNPSKWMEPEWGFPKGRRNPHEMDINCAIREFQEETGLKRMDFSMIQNLNPISETFFGSNGVHYCHKYYIALCNNLVNVKMNLDNEFMASEIGEIKWCSLDEAILKIRPDSLEKREILLKTSKIMRNYYSIEV
jgi:8-oxo-dGTP pyrophosphatase MutT (NUDIX family)